MIAKRSSVKHHQQAGGRAAPAAACGPP